MHPQISALLWLTVFRHCFVLGLMRFRLKIRIAAWLVFSLLATGWLVISHVRKGRVVDGLTLDQWLNVAAYFEDGRFETMDSAEFRKAARQFGTNSNGRQDRQCYGLSPFSIRLADRINNSRKFTKKDIEVVAVIDPVFKFRTPTQVPANVKRFWNRYQSKSGSPFYGEKVGASGDQVDLGPLKTLFHRS
jgi:hypothetical protein